VRARSQRNDRFAVRVRRIHHLQSALHANSGVSICHVLSEDPDLAELIDPEQRGRAIEHCVARTARIPRGRWATPGPQGLRDGIGLLVLEGLLLRRVGIDDRFGAELLGVGDLLRPWQGEDERATLALTTRWRVLEPVRLALLDAAAARRFAAYPELTGRLVDRALDRSRNLAINMAIVHQARVNVRLQMLFWHLADRWGRVGSAGILLPLSLTHTVLADLVAARRPTVTSALGDLDRQRLVLAVQDGWLLLGEPPGELLELQEVEFNAPSRTAAAQG
jgi:CRP/FNR family transcriptional regulator, cyclic AMP receptor protein